HARLQPTDHQPERRAGELALEVHERLVEVDARVQVRGELPAEGGQLPGADPAVEDPLEEAGRLTRAEVLRGRSRPPGCPRLSRVRAEDGRRLARVVPGRGRYRPGGRFGTSGRPRLFGSAAHRCLRPRTGPARAARPLARSPVFIILTAVQGCNVRPALGPADDLCGVIGPDSSGFPSRGRPRATENRSRWGLAPRRRGAFETDVGTDTGTRTGAS